MPNRPTWRASPLRFAGLSFTDLLGICDPHVAADTRELAISIQAILPVGQIPDIHLSVDVALLLSPSSSHPLFQMARGVTGQKLYLHPLASRCGTFWRYVLAGCAHADCRLPSYLALIRPDRSSGGGRRRRGFRFFGVLAATVQKRGIVHPSVLGLNSAASPTGAAPAAAFCLN